ncbi:MAG: ribonuclease HIII [Candidatus Pacebacteria bacterium]|nr:ribonuclease HIII [Candidatus Paceibacterota bacterium]
MGKTKTSYVCELTPSQTAQFKDLLIPKGWQFDDAPHALWRAKGQGATVIAYESGKVVIQGKGTPDVVQFVLEPEVLGEARFGYERELAEVENPEMFTAHAGIDESGKGDYFGPLVIASAYVDERTAAALLDAGVMDSKRIGSDKRVNDLCEVTKKTVRGQFSIVPIGPEAYNRLHGKLKNVNRILGWGHARALENLLEKVDDCPRAVSDQFASKQTVKRALMARGKSIELQQMPRAEADIAVAAASILARAEFVRRLQTLSEEMNVKLPKGASQAVINAAREVVAKHGRDALQRVAKVHFKTTARVLA